MDFYNNHEIKKYWNHPYAKIIDKLELDDLTKQTLQAVNKFEFIKLYPKSTAGLPNTLAKHLDSKPKYNEVVAALDQLIKLGYIKHISTKKEKPHAKKKAHVVLQFETMIEIIRRNIGTNTVGPLGF